MFIGEYSHSMDEKGRSALPSKFRNQLKKGAVVTRGLDRSLFLYPLDEWNMLAQKLAALPISQGKSRAFARLMLSGAMEVFPDSQGRILVPEYLRVYAGIGKKVVFAGLYNRVELWDEAQWSQYKAITEKESTEIAEAMGEVGI